METTLTEGSPRLAGAQGSVSPAEGLSFGINRVTQYGGGSRNQGNWSDFVDALTTSNLPDTGQTAEFGNRVASLTSSIVFPGKTPFAVNMEYAGEDNAYAGNYRLGATSMSVGIDLPQLWRDYDFTYEVSEWQNSWYVHHVYPRGLVHRGHVIGHWFGDERQFGDAMAAAARACARVGAAPRVATGRRLIARFLTTKTGASEGMTPATKPCIHCASMW